MHLGGWVASIVIVTHIKPCPLYNKSVSPKLFKIVMLFQVDNAVIGFMQNSLAAGDEDGEEREKRIDNFK